MDASVSTDRQEYIYEIVFEILSAELSLETKEDARHFFNQLRQLFLDYNGAEWKSDKFNEIETQIRAMIKEKKTGIDRKAKVIMDGLTVGAEK